MQNEMKSPKAGRVAEVKVRPDATVASRRDTGSGRVIGVSNGRTAVCPICRGTGCKIVERAGLSGAENARCAGEARAEALQEGSGIPPNYVRATLDNFAIPQDNPIARTGLGTVLHASRSFAREFPSRRSVRGCCWSGDTGTGKTHLAVGAMKAIIDKGHQGMFLRLPESAGPDSFQLRQDVGYRAIREAYRSALGRRGAAARRSGRAPRDGMGGRYGDIDHYVSLQPQ